MQQQVPDAIVGLVRPPSHVLVRKQVEAFRDLGHEVFVQMQPCLNQKCLSYFFVHVHPPRGVESVFRQIQYNQVTRSRTSGWKPSYVVKTNIIININVRPSLQFVFLTLAKAADETNY